MSVFPFIRRGLCGSGALLVIATASLRAAADPALDVVQAAVNEVLEIAYDQSATGEPLAARLRPVLEKYIDTEYATRSAVGPGWKSFTPEQQKETVELFTQLVIRTYADRFEPGPRPEISYGRPVEPARRRRQVPSTVTYQGERYAIAYRLRETAEGWRIYDVVIENVSMISNYRAQFDDLYRQGGAEAVIRSLRENLRQVPPPPAP